MNFRKFFLIAMGMIVFLGGCLKTSDSKSQSTNEVIRVATFNVEDLRTSDLKNPNQPRLINIATIIQQIRPDIILINEIAYDQPGAPGYENGDPEGQNGKRLASILKTPQRPDLEPLDFNAFMAPSNTGMASGFDLNEDGDTVTTFPPPPPPGPNGEPGRQTEAGRAYGNDSWGFGTFPGQYAMALLVNQELQILEDQVRTFRHLPWKKMPDALLPENPQNGDSWYSEEELSQFRLSSKSHWDVPVRLPNGKVLHLLCSHPTPPAFDGPEKRNQLRNHDEIRFWADYLEGAKYIVDDSGKTGGLESQARFLILGDLNADPDEGSSIDNPVTQFLLNHPRVNGEFVPSSEISRDELDPDDTAQWGLRVDYVLPSKDLKIVDGGVWRRSAGESGNDFPSDHFPVWVEGSLK